MMSVVLPIQFKPAMLISTTATEPNPNWAPGSYDKGAKVVHITRTWESLVNNNTDEPGATEQWLDIGPCNKCAMFDGKVSNQTVANSPLVFELEPGNIVSSIAFINLVGTSIRVEVFDGATPIYDSTKDLLGTEISDWWAYYFTEDEQITQAVFSDLPLYYQPRIRVTLTGAGPVAIGQVVFGTRQEIGSLALGARSGIIDYSRKETNEFGDTTFVRRAFADEFSGQIFVQNNQLNSIKRLLRSLLSTPSLWIGTDDETYTETLVVYGWYRQHQVAITYPEHSLVDIEIEGLT